MVPCPFCAETLSAVHRPSQGAALSACTHCMNPVALEYDGVTWQARPLRGVQDIREIAPEGSIGGSLLKSLPSAVKQLSILPEVAHRVLIMVRDPEIGIPDLVEVINQDQVIALKILQLANSPVYGGLTEIKDTAAACARLGMKKVSSTVHAIANGRLYVTKDPKYHGMMESLWRHALATAYCAGELAILLAEPGADVFFVAGLVHDVGKVLMLDLVANQPASKGATGGVKALRQSPELLDEFLHNYHALVGLHIVRHWNLPPEFAVSTFCHNQPEILPDDAWLTLVHIVSLSSAIAEVSGFGAGSRDITLLSHPAAKFFGLNDLKIAALRVDLEDKITPLLEVTRVA